MGAGLLFRSPRVTRADAQPGTGLLGGGGGWGKHFLTFLYLLLKAIRPGTGQKKNPTSPKQGEKKGGGGEGVQTPLSASFHLGHGRKIPGGGVSPPPKDPWGWDTLPYKPGWTPSLREVGCSVTQLGDFFGFGSRDPGGNATKQGEKKPGRGSHSLVLAVAARNDICKPSVFAPVIYRYEIAGSNPRHKATTL